MSIFKLDNLDLFYDDEFDILLDENNKICSNVPNETFAFNSKIYTYGTKVKIKENNGCVYIAEFTKDIENRDIFKGIYATNNAIALDKNELEPCYIEEIVEPVFYKSTFVKPNVIEMPPTEKGYITPVYVNNVFPELTKYKNHFLNCDIDKNGQIIVCYAPNTFGYKDKVYTLGTRVILKILGKFTKQIKYCISTFCDSGFTTNGYPITHIDLKTYHISRIVKQQDYKIIHILEPHYYIPK